MRLPERQQVLRDWIEEAEEQIRIIDLELRVYGPSLTEWDRSDLGLQRMDQVVRMACLRASLLSMECAGAEIHPFLQRRTVLINIGGATTRLTEIPEALVGRAVRNARTTLMMLSHPTWIPPRIQHGCYVC